MLNEKRKVLRFFYVISARNLSGQIKALTAAIGFGQNLQKSYKSQRLWAKMFVSRQHVHLFMIILDKTIRQI